MSASDRKFRSTRRFVAAASVVMVLGGCYLAYRGHQRLQSPGIEESCSSVDKAKDAIDSAKRDLFRDAYLRRNVPLDSPEDDELLSKMAEDYSAGKDAFFRLDTLLRQTDIIGNYHYRHDSRSMLFGGALAGAFGLAGLVSLGIYELRSRR